MLTDLQKKSVIGARERYEQLTLFDQIHIVELGPLGARSRCSTVYCGAKGNKLHWGYLTCDGCIAYRELTGLLMID